MDGAFHRCDPNRTAKERRWQPICRGQTKFEGASDSDRQLIRERDDLKVLKGAGSRC